MSATQAGEIPRLEGTDFEKLAEAFRGELLLSASPGYDTARRIWNGAIDRHPACIARCTGVADVVAAVHFARERDLVVAVRSGGHGVGGHAVCDGGVVIDLSAMKGIRVDVQARTARAEAGGRMFLLADEPGVGKTISAVLGATAVGDLRGARRVLVVADRPAAITIGHWCRTIAALGHGGLEWVVITWDRLEKVAGHDWDVIIADEAHALRRTTTKRWKPWARISGHGQPHDRAPFVIATTATPGHTPLELPYLAPAYAQVLGEPMREWTSATKPAEPTLRFRG